MNYYNEWDKDAAAWLRELKRAGLIPDGDIDERSITDVKAHELTGYTQCHFFAGIGGWPLAFQLAGIDPSENADSGSCPCQPFSGTGKQMGFADPRHLWPTLRRIENRRRAAKVYGEQVASKLGREWLSRVFSDLEIMGYAGSGADLCSAGVGAPNIRQRLYWFADRMEYAAGDGRIERGAKSSGRGVAGGCGSGGVAEPDRRQLDRFADGEGRQRNRSQAGRQQGDGELESGGDVGGVGYAMRAGSFSASQSGAHPSETSRGARDGVSSGSSPTRRLGYADHARREGRIIRWNGGYQRAAGETSVAGPATFGGFWGVADLVFCRDEKWRRIESGSFPLVNGIPSRVGPLLTELRKLGRRSVALARANRNLRLKGYGNAINPWVAAQFIQSTRGSGGAMTPDDLEPLPSDTIPTPSAELSMGAGT